MEKNNTPEKVNKAPDANNVQNEFVQRRIDKLAKDATREGLLAGMYEAVVPQEKKKTEANTVLSALNDITKKYTA